MACVLGIESSCDETAVAIYDAEKGLLAHALYSQIKTHRRYGGVVPELASRDHVKKLIPMVQQALSEAQLTSKAIDGIAYTSGPGLIGALLVGGCFARSLAWGWGVPCIAVDHLEAHLLAPMLDTPSPDYPFVALLVSGGHTQLVEVRSFGHYSLLGETLDDAVGEAFDKTAKLLGLPYPGGPHLARLAESGRAGTYTFPKPMTNRPGLDFSFSGLKTFALNTWLNGEQSESERADIAHAFQQAICDTLLIKCRRAMAQCSSKRLVVAGGVSANVQLRSVLTDMMLDMGGEIFFPRFEFCTDNGAMVAYTGCQHLLAGKQLEGLNVVVNPRHHRWSSLA